MTSVAGGWAAAWGGAKVGAWGGARLGGAIALGAGQLGPQVAAPEEVVTVPLGAAIGGVVGGLVGGVGGYFGGREVTETVFDWIHSRSCCKMRNERLVGLRQLQPGGTWPTYYVITDGGCYEYTGQAFISRAAPAASVAISTPPEYEGRTIADVRGDGESAVISLDNEDTIVFDLVHDPFGPTVESQPALRFVRSSEAREWQDDYDAMDPL